MKTKFYSFRLVRFLLAIAICLPVWGSNVFAQTVESYVVLDNAAGTLTFKHDANKPAGAFSLNEGETFPAWYDGGYDGDGNEYNKTTLRKLSLMLLLPMRVPQIVTPGFICVGI